MIYPKVFADRRKRITPAMANRMFALYEEGVSCAEIARRLNCSYFAVWSRVHPRGIEFKENLPTYQKQWKKHRLTDPQWRAKYQDGKNKFILLRYHTEEAFKRYMQNQNTNIN